MIRYIVKISGTLVAIIGSVLLVIFGEGLLISSIVLIGSIYTFCIFSIVFILLSFFILYLYQNKIISGNKIVVLTQGWIKRKEEELLRKRESFVKYGKVISTLILAVTIGPLPTTVYISLVDFPPKERIILVLTNNVLFFLVWIMIYSGGLKVILTLFN